MKKTLNLNTQKEFLKDFGSHIRKLRKEKGYSQAELAHRCNSDIKKIGRTERGEYNFKVSSLLVLAKGLNTKINDLLDFDYSKDILNKLWNE